MPSTTVTQLDPTIPVHVDAGALPNWARPAGCAGVDAMAVGWIDYGPEHHLIWVVALDDGGRCWQVQNPFVSLQWNQTMGRRNPKPADPRPPRKR